eukprot:Filipodium_phascolosomae@DN30_c0_g1_i1.p1
MTKVLHIKDKEEWDSLRSTKEFLVADFFAEWCGPCKIIAPYLEELAATHTQITFVSVDIDQLLEVAEGEGISAMPTFKFYRKGEQVADLTGANKGALAEKVKLLLKDPSE